MLDKQVLILYATCSETVLYAGCIFFIQPTHISEDEEIGSMKENYKVSVIMPAHNAEQYIGACMESILAQTLREIQIICINDGSTDSTEAIIRSYMEKDERISVLNQENRYAGVARNEGMKLAKGKYMVFWDADDLFEPAALETMYRKIEEDQADICVCDAVRFKDGSTIARTDVQYIKDRFMPEKIPFSIRNFPQYIFNFTTDVPWNKMYRREFIEANQIEFEDRIRGNDHYFVLQAFAVAKGITLVKQQLIRYRMNSSGNLTSNLSASPLCAYEALLHAKESLEEKGVFRDERAVQSFANRALNSLIYVMERQTGKEAYELVYNTLRNGGFEKLFVTDKGKDFYYYASPYEKYKKIMSLDPMEYLMIQYAAVSDKEADLRRKYTNLQNRNTALKEKISESTEEKKKLQKELDYIKKKKWYRLIVCIADLKNKITGKGK